MHYFKRNCVSDEIAILWGRESMVLLYYPRPLGLSILPDSLLLVILPNAVLSLRTYR